MNFVARFMKDESGATAIEYALIAAMLSLAVIAAMGLLGGALNESFTNTATKVGDAI